MTRLRDTLPAVTPTPQRLGALADALVARGVGATLRGNGDVEVRDVTLDSRTAGPGVLFAAVTADTTAGRDGHQFVDAALAAGAPAALVSDEWAEALRGAAPAPLPLGKGEHLAGAAFVSTPDTRAALGEVAAELYGRPARAFDAVGITGTNGKTTTAFLLHAVLTTLGGTVGLVGTVENRIGEARYATAFTTPEAPALQRFLAACRDAGCTAVAMEVSSHGLALDRVRGVPFRAAVFTNLTRDHLDFHPSFGAYRDAKKRLFDGLGPDAVAIVNADDEHAAAMTADCAARVVTFGTCADADVRVEVLANDLDGLRLRLDGHERRFRVVGRFNALNLAAAYAVARELGHAPEAALDALAEAPGVPGRFETVRSADGVLGVVDYAHTPDALDNVLATAGELVPEGNELWVVFGAGGDRDRGKRADMGDVATRHTPRAVITSDNPRTEDPAAIIEDISMGTVRPAVEIVDRGQAIAHAARAARPGDVVVVAGKGHETYQIVGTERRTFDDRAALRAAFAQREVAA